MSGLSLEQVSFNYDQSERIIEQVSLKARNGEFLSIVGRSGCGKTTLLKVASGLLQPTSGTVRYDGNKVEKPSERSGFVFQSPTLLEWKSVLANVLLPARLKGAVTNEMKKRATELLEMVGLRQHLNDFPSVLSGGQQSRVALARALMNRPSLLFLDEPFAALDAITREELQQELSDICRLNQITVLFITHDIAEAVYLSERIMIVEKGRLVQEYRVAIGERTLETRYSAAFNKLCLDIRRSMGEGGR